MRHSLYLLAAALVACTPVPPAYQTTTGKGDSPAQPTQPTQPAQPAQPATPAPQKSGCNGITAQGTCQIVNGHQLSQTCNTAASTLNPAVDCTAAGQVCGFDSTGTAVCRALGATGGTKGAPLTGSTTTNTTTTTSGCGTLTYDGLCNGNTVHYCLNGMVTDLQCGTGNQCTTNGSCGGQGAECCPTQTSTTTTGGGACGTLTYDGVCNGNTIHYCLDGAVTDLPCGSDSMCKSNVCGSGALCCPTSTSTTSPDMGGGSTGAGNCGSVTYAGTCIDMNTMQFCDGGTLTVSTCDNGLVCQVGATGAQCVSASSGAGNCGSITYAGTCIDSTTLEYCDGGTLTVSDCSPGTCGTDSTGYNCIY